MLRSKALPQIILTKSLAVACLLMCYSGFSLWGQNGTVLRGKILDAITGEVLLDAQVGVRGQPLKVFSNSDGEFALSIPHEFPIILQVGLENYQTTYPLVESNAYLEVNLQPGPATGNISPSQVIRVFGKVLDEENQPLKNANILARNLQVQGRPVGTNTDKDGSFYLFFEDFLPAILEVSSLGYETQQIVINSPKVKDLNIILITESVGLDEVVIRGEKIEQEILRADYSIEKLDVKELQLSPSFDFYDAIAGLKDVDVATQSMQFQSINARGFNATGNVRFVQMVDGMDNQAPGFGFPVGNFAGISELDIESIELIPGPASAQYGLNAFNGILFMKSKDPFLFQGLSASLKLAANRFPEGGGGSGFFDVGGSGVYDFSFRYSKAINDKIAAKVNFSIISATDWTANNFDNIGIGKRFETHDDVPGYNGVNVYGDELQAELPIGPLGANVTVTRTGYAEEDLFDYDFTNYKLNGAIHYKIGENLRAIVQGNYGTGNTFYTGDNRMFLRNFELFQGKVELQSERLTLRTYITQQTAGDSFDGRFLALQLMRAARSDEDWFKVYQAAFSGLLISRGVAPGDHQGARAAADSDLQLLQPAEPRIEPGTEVFETKRNQIINTRGFDEGAGFKDNTSLLHFDGSYDFSGLWKFLDISLGTNYRFYDPESSGVLFPDSLGNDLTLFEYGAFLQASKRLLVDKLKITSSIRVDKNENFDTRFTPRFSLVYTYNTDHNFRASYQTGFRFPTLREQFSSQDLGSAKLFGGLSFLIEPLDLAGNGFFEQTIDAFNQAVGEDTNPDPEINPTRFNQEQAELKNIQILEAGIVGPTGISEIKPEQIRTIELGYKSVLAQNKLLIDLTYYHNTYQDFIGIIRVIKTKTSPDRDLFIAARQINNSTEREVFFINNNAREEVRSQGVSFNVDYTSNGGFVVGFNGAWAQLNSDPEDPIIPGFNTPKIKINYSLGHNNITQNMGFKVTLRTRSSYDWESNFGDGLVENYFNLDLQLNWRLPGIRSMLKVGMSNLGNEYYANTFGGPRIGSLPYVQLTYDPLFY